MRGCWFALCLALSPAQAAENNDKFSRGFAQELHRVTISGRALNEAGEPVAAATIYLMPNNEPYASQELLGQTTTREDGGYEFADIELPVVEHLPEPIPQPIQGGFQVFGTADGYGYTWRRTHLFRPEARPAETAPADEDLPLFYRDEPIQINLQFRPAAKLSGKVTDDAGRPITGAIIQVGLFNTLRDQPGETPRAWTCFYREDAKSAADGSFYGLPFLPEDMRQTHSNERGEYQIAHLPPDAELGVAMDCFPECDPLHVNIVTAEGRDSTNRIFTGSNGRLDHVFQAPRVLHVSVARDDNGQPVAGATAMAAARQRTVRGGNSAITGPDGIATLRLLPGDYELQVRPALEVPLSPATMELSIAPEPLDQRIPVALAPLAAVEFSVVGPNGEPVAEVHMLRQSFGNDEWLEVQSRSFLLDHPRTHDDGKFTAHLPPGRYRFSADRPPARYQAQDADEEPVELTVGQTTKVSIALAAAKVDAVEPLPALTKEDHALRALHAKMLSQSNKIVRGHFELRKMNHLPTELSAEELQTLMDSLESRTFEEACDTLRQRFPELDRMALVRLTVDGNRCRDTTISLSGNDQNSYRWEHVFNGQETAHGRAGQFDVWPERGIIHTTTLHDFWQRHPFPFMAGLPEPGQQPGDPPPVRTVKLSEKIVEIQSETPMYSSRLKVDRATGLVLGNVLRYNGQFGGHWQLFPVEVADGVFCPRLNIKFGVRRLAIHFVDHIELVDRLPVDAFALAAPAGVTVVLHPAGVRGQQAGKPAVHPLRTSVHDIVAHAAKWPTPREAKLRVGDAAPKFSPRVWVNQQGETEPPALEGKLVLIDFWGIGCGSCVSQLPKVQAAAQHFADSDLAIVGLHDQYVSMDDLAEYAAKKKLTLPLAIDRGGLNGGATFADFDVYGMPAAVLIDRLGQIAYIGHFEEALQTAARLLEVKE